MQAGVPPVPDTVASLLAAADEISGLSDDSSGAPGQEAQADNMPADGLTKEPSWVLPQQSREPETKADEYYKAAAKRGLVRAHTILDEFDMAAGDAWSVMEELQSKEADNDSASSAASVFLQSEQLKLLSYIARFIGRDETLESLDAQHSKILERLRTLQARLAGEMEGIESLSVRAKQDTENQSIREETDALTRRFVNAVELLVMYAIVSDFSNAAQWLKVYDGGTSFDETVRRLAIKDHPQLLDCFETLRNLPRMRAEIGTIG
jgi:hypothetical protein